MVRNGSGYATAYHNALATPNGNNPSIHPSQPNYLWSKAGTNFDIFNDNNPYTSPGDTNQNTNQHLSGFLMQAGRTWRSNDMHTAITGGFQGKTGDEANIAQGDNFLSIIVTNS